jgi:hypothetical protein
MRFLDSPPQLKDVKWSLGPRHIGAGSFNHFVAEPLAEREYFHLVGLIIKWYHIYGQFPKSDSCKKSGEGPCSIERSAEYLCILLHFSVGVWKWYPHGGKWLESVLQFRNRAVERATSPYYYSVDSDTSRRTAFSPSWKKNSTEIGSNSQPYELASTSTPGRAESSTLGVFYHADADSDPFVVKEQLEAIRAAAQNPTEQRPVSLFYSVVGTSGRHEAMAGEEIKSMCHNQASSSLQCHKLPEFSVPYEGETLRHLHLYCQRHPSSQVVYVQSELPPYMKSQIHLPEQRQSLLIHLTRAALSPQCIAAVQSNGNSSSVCNTCGLVFYKLWTLFYPGNMFAASCEYINQLLPPDVFETKMIEYAKTALLLRLRTNVQSKVFTGPSHAAYRKREHDVDRLEVWGIDRYSVDFWLGSHPMLSPCDVSQNATQDLSYWQRLQHVPAERGNESMRLGNQYGPAVEAPTQHGSPFFLVGSKLDAVLSTYEDRVREITFLAGHLMKWIHLYGIIPSGDSRIWSMFPDGDMFKQSAQEFGKDVVKKVTQKFVTFE